MTFVSIAFKCTDLFLYIKCEYIAFKFLGGSLAFIYILLVLKDCSKCH